MLKHDNKITSPAEQEEVSLSFSKHYTTEVEIVPAPRVRNDESLPRKKISKASVVYRIKSARIGFSISRSFSTAFRSI